jgi:hypothetical protein
VNRDFFIEKGKVVVCQKVKADRLPRDYSNPVKVEASKETTVLKESDLRKELKKKRNSKEDTIE